MRYWALALLPALLLPVEAQITGAVSGNIIDSSGQPVPSARIALSNPVTGYRHETTSDAGGAFSIVNIPPRNYTLVVVHEGFAEERRPLVLRSNVPLRLTVSLALAQQTARVDVSAYDSRILVEPEVTGTRTELNAASMEKMPLPAASRGLEGVLLSFPGFAANANGAIHPRGAHNQMTYVIDGMPVTDQLTGSFANAVDPAIVEGIELYTGNVPAEFGSKVSGVAVVTTKSGAGTGRRFSGSTQVSAAQFDTLSQVTQFSGGTPRFGYFFSFNALKSNRFLDQVTLDNPRNGGNSERAFSRIDWQASPRDTVRFNLLAGRSAFQLTNLPSQHRNGQEQRQRLEDLSASIGWLRSVDARTTIDVLASWRAAIAQLYPSAGDTPVTAAQARHLTTVSAGVRFNRVEGSHTIRGGLDFQRFPVREHFSFAITDPLFNQPGSPNFNASLVPFDLSRGGERFEFWGANTGGLYSTFGQDVMHWRRFVVSLGLRYDAYRFLAVGNQLQPRVGLSFHLRETGTVLRASYNRNYQTPPNENLLLSSAAEASVLAPPSVREALGSAAVRIRPERQNVYEVGVQQAMVGRASLNASFYHKNSRDMQDNDNFFNTGIIFPTSLKQARVNGAEMRLAVPAVHGFSGSVSLTHYHAVVTPPFTGGLFLGSAAITALTSGPFVIDHDQVLGAQSNLQYTMKNGVWASVSTRYDSGLVSNPSDPALVAADPDHAALLPYVDLLSSPPRVRPRTVTDVALGYQRIQEGRRLWECSVQVSNIGDKTALYNFQSVFVGTRLIQPRTASVRLRWYF